LGPLFIATGIAGLLNAAAYIDTGRMAMTLGAIEALAVGLVALVVPWARVPTWAFATFPFLSLGNILVAEYGTAELPIVGYFCMAMLFVWGGTFLSRTKLFALLICTSAVAVIPRWGLDGPNRSLALGGIVAVLVGSIGFVTHRMQERLDASAGALLDAQREAADERLAAERAREAQAQERAGAVAAELARREALQEQVAAEATALADSTREVSDRTVTVAAAAEEMTAVFEDLYRTAAQTNEVTDGVARKAVAANELMGLLAAAGTQIMGAAEVIQRIGAQTNLLALNATIESARAGEAGRGFAVVAQEVKTLAAQSGENAETISRTLSDVQARIAEAAGAADEIRRDVDVLSTHNQQLAGAMQEQAAALREISIGVTTTAQGAGDIADRVASLDQVVREASAAVAVPVG
jgi:hypothetical protein